MVESGSAMVDVLICDDSRFMRLMLSRIIRKMGYRVVGEASNGLEAVEKYKQLKPDLVTLDIVMSKLDGIRALKQIKSFDPEARVIMVTAIGNQAMVLSAMRFGAKEFIVKPFKQNEVIQAIHRALE